MATSRMATAPCVSCRVQVDWYLVGGHRHRWLSKEADTGNMHWEYCAWAQDVHEKMAAVTAALKESE